MKNIIFLSVFAAFAFASCKKKETTISSAVTVHYPTVTVKTSHYYSFPVGALDLPSAQPNSPYYINATAYDSFYNESCPVVVDVSGLRSDVPGLYIATVSAKNKNGHIGYDYVYVAITDVPDSLDISGLYLRTEGGVQYSSAPAFISKVGAGLYYTSNLAGVDTGSESSKVVSGVFAVTSDTTIAFGSQFSKLGSFTTAFNALVQAAPDTLLQYAIHGNSNFSREIRTFRKQ